ncbi:ComF family protein [bacterium]|nr:MAG: ComF family protein [bacterium]
MILTHYLLDIIFPPICFGCKKYLRDGGEKMRRLCGGCSRKLDFMPGLLCPVCFRRLPTETLMESDRPPCHKGSLFALAAPLQFANPVACELVHILKYGKVRAAAEPLANVLADYLADSAQNSKLEIGNFILISVPLHPKKERERGFNQALVLIELLKQKSEILRKVPILTGALVRTRPTLSQTKKKNREEREENIRGCFGVRNPELIAGKNILLVDDVFTSGATMREAARTLKSAGAKKIIALAVARA